MYILSAVNYRHEVLRVETSMKGRCYCFDGSACRSSRYRKPSAAAIHKHHITCKCESDTYDHRSVRTGHPVRNHGFTICVHRFDENSGKEGIVIPGTWNTRDSRVSRDRVILDLIPRSRNLPDVRNLEFDF